MGQCIKKPDLNHINKLQHSLQIRQIKPIRDTITDSKKQITLTEIF